MRAARAAPPLNPARAPAVPLEDIERAITALSRRPDVALSRHRLHYRCGRFQLLRLASKPLPASTPLLLVRAGIHGDEVAGPITLARHLERLFDRAHSSGIGMLVYPLGNPSGYLHGLRYNADHDTGDEGNNDFLRYLLADGRWAGALAPGQSFTRFAWSSDPVTGVRLPLETTTMHRVLRADPLAQVRAAVDLHQDHLTPGADAAAYHYAFGDRHAYAGIIACIRRHLPVLAHTAIGAGFGTRIDATGQVLGTPMLDGAPVSDGSGFIERHDGTLSDLMWRLGVPYSVAPETTRATSLDVSVEVNVAWLEGLIDLLAGERNGNRAHG